MMFRFMEMHSDIDLVNAPMPPKHPKVAEIWQDFTTWKKISEKFADGKTYTDTYKLGLDIRKCFNCYQKIYFDDPDKLNKLSELQIYFE